ncbi:uncharacterized protein F4822DRAFT_384471 [Hypoxylon trugodes]|uniref:uncharacterized protein n=1 Tax=Hypoxylon trugodes TaxID=326681 RepID=UPI00218F343B|nr:uncharacterized protein F4822DRAFT_384471 [Hypoxylon trugodes]KAI1393382.1 hypothetical protein F4822DRAFT_384471 [Hypoxylon trugodes]
MSYLMPAPESFSPYIPQPHRYFHLPNAIGNTGVPLPPRNMNSSRVAVATELGLKPIHLACLLGDYEQVLRESCIQIAIDMPTEPQMGLESRSKETPIKLAALMGHLNIVEFFMQRGASLAHDGLHASVYAKEDGLAKRRRVFFLEGVKIGREHPDAVNTRKTIYDILSSPGRRSVLNAMRSTRADLGYPDYKLAKQGRYIAIYAPVLRVRTDIYLDRSKTIGVLTSSKGDGAVLMTAHSGYKPGGGRDEDKCLDTNRWNYIALHHIAARLKFVFPGSKHDNASKTASDEHRGRAHAGHVEVLLASWYAIEMVKREFGGEIREDGVVDVDQDLEYLLERLRRLKHIELGNKRSAVIFIDSQPCNPCLRFINRLFQHTGLWFTVQGAAGIGPTLATKNDTGVRYDTFGDVFEDSEDEGEDDQMMVQEEEDEVDAIVGLGAPAEIEETTIMATLPNPTGIRDTTEGDETIAQAASEAFSRIAKSRAPVPEPESDTDLDTGDESTHPNTPIAAPARAELETPKRPRMQWPLPENRTPRTPKTRGDSWVLDTPSRKPENHLELLAEYKKKTPVWNFPGYGTGSQSHYFQQRQPPYPPPPPPPQLPRNFRAPMAPMDHERVASVSGDAIIVDLTNDGDPRDDFVSQPSMAENGVRMNNHDNGTSTQNSEGFSFSSFAPAISRERDDTGAEQQQSPQPQANPTHQPPDVIMHTDSDEDAEGEDDDYYYVPTQQCTQQSHISPAKQAPQTQQQDEDKENVSLISTPCPVPSAANLIEQWRYQPQPQHRPRLHQPQAQQPQQHAAVQFWSGGGWVMNPTEMNYSKPVPVPEPYAVGPVASDEGMRGMERYEYTTRKKGNMYAGQFVSPSIDGPCEWS